MRYETCSAYVSRVRDKNDLLHSITIRFLSIVNGFVMQHLFFGRSPKTGETPHLFLHITAISSLAYGDNNSLTTHLGVLLFDAQRLGVIYGFARTVSFILGIDISDRWLVMEEGK